MLRGAPSRRKPVASITAEKVEKTAEALTIGASQQGYAFAQVRPRYDRDEINRRINITFMIDEGPRIYIERINIVGNFRTHDDVIRREFCPRGGRRLQPAAGRGGAEPLTLSRLLQDRRYRHRAWQRSRPRGCDRESVEQPTGELSFGAGYSTSEGVIGDISITERNLMGKGQYVRLGFSGSLERAQVDFSFTEPHFLDRNLAAGFDLFHKEVDFTDVASYQGAQRRRRYQVRIPHRRRYPAWSALQVGA